MMLWPRSAGAARRLRKTLNRPSEKETTWRPTYASCTSPRRGFHDIKDTVKRADAFKHLAKSHGAEVKEFLWTQGAYDMITIMEARTMPPRRR
jgi:GYD domain